MMKSGLLCLCLFAGNLFCQTLQLPRNMQLAYNNGTRARDGNPGSGYWQNRADYNINVSFNPADRRLEGVARIDYYNNSTDTLFTLLFKLYPNFYKADAIRNMPVALQDLQPGGMHITVMTVDGKNVDSTNRLIKGTNMHVNSGYVLPGQKVHVEISFNYTLNKGSFVRTGQVDTGAYFIAYFFPRIAVYDDVDGWNEYPYAGREEFYNDYGNFEVAVTIPPDYLLWGTGEQTNVNEVFQPAFAQRIGKALTSDTITDIVTIKDLQAASITRGNITNTWKLQAKNVSDFAFAISNHFIWKAAGITTDTVAGHRTRIDAVFNPLHTQYSAVAAYARKTVSLICNGYPGIPFPYPHMTIFEGLDAMEYPMMVNNKPFTDPKDIVEFTTHEVFHNIFPFYVGTNETRHSFMDEGWATLTEWLFHPIVDSSVPLQYDISPMNEAAGTEEDMPVITPTTQLYGKARYADKDLKPALALWHLRELLGDNKFWHATRVFINAWKGKHPTPYDFFNCFNTATGINLNWFWQNWYMEKNVPDLAISRVNYKGRHYSIDIGLKGSLYVPIHLNIIYSDGTTGCITKNIACWKTGVKTTTVTFNALKPVKEIILGDNFDADVQPADNRWPTNRR